MKFLTSAKDALIRVGAYVHDAYLWLVDWVDDHPQMALWIAFAVIVLALVF